MKITKKSYAHLITSGCSFTSGVGLTDPLRECWPAQLAILLDCKLTNLAAGGAGPEHISNTILDVLPIDDPENTLVAVAWSDWSRALMWSETTRCPQHFTSNSKFATSKLFFKQHYDNDFFFQKAVRQIINLQQRLDTQGVDWVDMYAYSAYENTQKLGFKTPMQPGLPKLFTDVFGGNKSPCKHPDKSGHKLIAEYIFDSIKVVD